uniref:ATP synthase CF1 epsilon subunit n=1 Tax=Kryptoperidinium triquetrum TaxID=66468 RepID=A8I1Q3_KRYTR|nr:ATP synthase CF1 epsilon subunit [Heterocapsa triquetra]
MKVLSPEGTGITETVSEVVLPSASGQLGVLANHAPMITALDIGVLRYKQGGEWKPLVTYGGFAQVDSNMLSILVNDFDTVEDIDGEAAKKDLEAATAKLESAGSKKEKLDATAAVKKASARLQATMFGKK